MKKYDDVVFKNVMVKGVNMTEISEIRYSGCNSDIEIINKYYFVNLTPHCINIVVNEREEIYKIEASGNIARCTQKTEVMGNIGGINITYTKFGDVENLPEPKEGVYYIVSRLVLSACKNRNDLLAPNELVRNEEGQIIGCKSFSNN